MQLKAYSIYDRKTLTYTTPFFQPTDGSATRMLKELVDDINTFVGKHPNDYVMFFIGTYDDQLGLLIPQAPLVHVVDAQSLVQEQKNLFTPIPDDHN